MVLHSGGLREGQQTLSREPLVLFPSAPFNTAIVRRTSVAAVGFWSFQQFIDLLFDDAQAAYSWGIIFSGSDSHVTARFACVVEVLWPPGVYSGEHKARLIGQIHLIHWFPPFSGCSTL